ncbi:hypothetical protein BB560_005159, partial [Smittium megazygosporum]
LNQGRNIMVGKLLGGESKETRSLLAQSRDRYSPYMKELETGRFMNGIRVVRTLILDRIKCSPTPLNQCPVDYKHGSGVSFNKESFRTGLFEISRFLYPLFLYSQKTGDFKPALDPKGLIKHVEKQNFKMKILAKICKSICYNELLHILIYKNSSSNTHLSKEYVDQSSNIKGKRSSKKGSNDTKSLNNAAEEPGIVYRQSTENDYFSALWTIVVENTTGTKEQEIQVNSLEWKLVYPRNSRIEIFKDAKLSEVSGQSILVQASGEAELVNPQLVSIEEFIRLSTMKLNFQGGPKGASRTDNNDPSNSPLWKSAIWFPNIVGLSIAQPMVIQATNIAPDPKSGKSPLLKYKQWVPMAWRISRGILKVRGLFDLDIDIVNSNEQSQKQRSSYFGIQWMFLDLQNSKNTSTTISAAEIVNFLA